MLRNYTQADRPGVAALWERSAARQGYAPRTPGQLGPLVFEHPYFDPRHAFVWETGGGVGAFICGCTGDDLPRGGERGYFTCFLADEALDSDAVCAEMFAALEETFRAAGKRCSAVTFFNPMRLPWVIPGTPGFEHNNMPGIATGLPLYGRMLAQGYREAARECAMYRSLEDFALPPEIEALEARLAAGGCTVQPYDPARHTGLGEMLEALGNPDWTAQITRAGQTGQLLPVALCGSVVAGFAGPVYPEPTGRGYFAGIGIAPAYQGRGLGRLLFFRLCQAEKEAGARYMSLFTGETNHARKIYESAGFRQVRSFGVLLKEL